MLTAEVCSCPPVRQLLDVGDLGPNPGPQSRPRMRLGVLEVTFRVSEQLSDSL